MAKHPTNPQLRKDLVQHRTANNLTNRQLAEIFGESETFLSKYINDKLDHNPKDFNDRAFDILKSLKLKQEFSEELFETSVSRNMHGRINFIRETSDVGLLHGRAGIGKSSAALLYVERNPSSLYVELNARTREAKECETAVFDSIEHRSWKGNTNRLNYLIERLSDSQRVIIFDNAQRLTSSGLQWVFDFNDKTKCPIVLIGNPEVLDKIKNNDQQNSRIGVSPPSFALQKTEINSVAKNVAIQFSDEETADEIEDLCAIVAKHDGHLRSVRKQVILMQAIRKLTPQYADDPRGAFRVAHQELVRNYDLPV